MTPKELASKDSATLLKEADELFEKKSFTEAKTLYAELLNRNYKPAKINFNLGEIAYNQKSYTSSCASVRRPIRRISSTTMPIKKPTSASTASSSCTIKLDIDRMRPFHQGNDA